MNRYDMTLDGTERSGSCAVETGMQEGASVRRDGMVIRNPSGMKVMLISQSGKLQGLLLPYPAKGSMHFPKGADVDIPVYFEADAGKWYGVRNLTSRFLTAGDPFEKRMLIRNQDLMVIKDAESLFMLYTEEVNDASFVRHNYAVLPSDLYIGRTEGNDIIYPAQMISGRHAVLHYNGSSWSITDLDSRNGIYVNGFRVKSMYLSLGDVIDIFGLQIIIGSGFLSINDGNDRVAVSGQKARPVSDTDYVMSNVLPERGRKSVRLFNRYPRKRLMLEENTIELDNPPMPLGDDGIPLIMRMGGSMIMSGTAAMTGNLTMLASSLLLPLLSHGYSKEDKEEYEEKRLEKYREYLDEKRDEILREKEQEEQILRHNYPELSTVLEYVYGKKDLWARSKKDDDFLQLRIGRGNLPLRAKLNYSRQHFEMEEDVLSEEMYALAEEEVLLEDVPVMIDLTANNVIGVQGPADDVAGFMNTLVMRLAVLFSYDEVKLCFLLDEEQAAQMEYVKYLPHTWDDQRQIRFLATNASEAYQVGEYLQKELEEDIEGDRKLEKILDDRPYYIVFAFSKKLYDGVEILKRAAQKDKTAGISVITGFPDVPKECSVLIELNKEEDGETFNNIIYVRELDREDDTFIPDGFDGEEAQKSMRVLANTRLRLVSQAYALPKTLSFLEMFGAGRIEDLNIAKRWQTSDPVSSLAVPIGIGTDGADFMLDLHQKYQGPHGLVAGTTGSGKSEFLLTYILSLAVNFHPDEVAFLLIDYKGGGLAGAFDDPANGIHLPHLLGTITNLDGVAINRSLVSIQSEMLRRQRIFNEAKSQTGEGTMDIYTYQRLHRTGAVKKPMPHLFIISDEFAELKQQQPDFLDQLVSIARIGRSLGVHLILATQKPSGVVTDQILSNTKFRVCLKVQDKADSMDMLKRPEASELRETGRFYLQVGNNEFFALGQSAWSGAEYEPQDQVVVQRDESVQVIDSVGAPVLTVKPEVQKNSSGRSQLVSIVKHIMETAKEEGVGTEALWLPVLPDAVSVDECGPDEAEKTFLNCFIGRLDDPAKQAQYPLFLDLETCGHILVCGEPGSGKTTFVQTLLHSLTVRYTPEEFNFYIVDYSSRLLKLFRSLPHCGAVLEEDQADQNEELFRLINRIVAERKKLFSELEVSNFSEAVRVAKLPFVMLIIDNFAGFTQTRSGQKQYEQLQNYLKNSANYGICYLVTINHVNEMNMRTRQEFKQKIALQLRDKYDYTDILEIKVKYLPPEKPGRGIFDYNGEPLEMQLAMTWPDLEQKERTQAIKDEVKLLRQRYQGDLPARQLAQIQPEQEYEDFMQSFAPGRLPLGYDIKTSRAVALPLKQFGQLSLYLGDTRAIVPVLKNMVSFAKREKMVVVLLKRASESCFEELGLPEDARIFEPDKEGIEQFVTFLSANTAHRYGLYEKYCQEKKLDPKNAVAKQEVFSYTRESFRPILVLLERYSDLGMILTETSGYKAKLSSLYMLAKYCQIYYLAGFYENEPAFLWGQDIFRCFNPAKLAMLFGKRFRQQGIVQVPVNMETELAKKEFHSFLMSYRNDLHEMLMPCGAIRTETVATDDDSIF